MERQTGFGDGKQPLGFELREVHNLIKMLIHKMHPPCARPGTPLTQLQGGILGYLYHHDPAEPVYQKNIEEAFRISRATATNTLQVMERNGLITRKSQDQDARLKRIFMTEEACREHTQMEKQMEELDAQMLAGMSGEEEEQFLTLLDRVRDNLERMNAEYDEQQKHGDSPICDNLQKHDDSSLCGEQQKHGDSSLCGEQQKHDDSPICDDRQKHDDHPKCGNQQKCDSQQEYDDRQKHNGQHIKREA